METWVNMGGMLVDKLEKWGGKRETQDKDLFFFGNFGCTIGGGAWEGGPWCS